MKITHVLHGDGYVLERIDSAGNRDVSPLPGWAVMEDGTLRALPFDLDPDWRVRLQMPSDHAAIRRTAAGTNVLRTWNQVDDEVG